jgi:hypothetical protein
VEAARSNGPQNMKRFIFAIFVTLSCAASLQAQRCAVCDLPFDSVLYTIQDRVTDQQVNVCDKCLALTTRCYLCALPVRNNITTLGDGRVLCARDSKGVVLSVEEAMQVCDETRNELARVFSRFLSFPVTNVTTAVVDKVHMEQLFKTAGFDNQCPSIFGYIRSRTNEQGEVKHAISLLSGLPRARLMSVCAHEMAHSWVNEHVTRNRQVHLDAVEGFCELVAYKLMAYLGREPEQRIIKANHYTRGQIDLFLAADNEYGFYTIMEWMQSGLDASLDGSDLDRVRRVKFQPQRSATAEFVPLPKPALTPVPDTLTLIGVSGTGSRRLALVNDRAFGAGESGKVRVAKTNVVVRCLEVRNDSVLIEVEGSPEKQELFLKSK